MSDHLPPPPDPTVLLIATLVTAAPEGQEIVIKRVSEGILVTVRVPSIGVLASFIFPPDLKAEMVEGYVRKIFRVLAIEETDRRLADF